MPPSTAGREARRYFSDRRWNAAQSCSENNNEVLREAFQKFHKSLDEFSTIVGRNFFATSDDRYMLYPELRHSGEEEERRIFEEARIETKNASCKTLEAFSNFRQSVKQTLYV